MSQSKAIAAVNRVRESCGGAVGSPAYLAHLTELSIEYQDKISDQLDVVIKLLKEKKNGEY